MMGLKMIFHRTPSFKYTFAGRNETKVYHLILIMYKGMLLKMRFKFESTVAEGTLVWSDIYLKNNLFVRERFLRLLT